MSPAKQELIDSIKRTKRYLDDKLETINQNHIPGNDMDTVHNKVCLAGSCVESLMNSILKYLESSGEGNV